VQNFRIPEEKVVVKDKERGRIREQIRAGPKASSKKWRSIAGRLCAEQT
jgi:hypothetical protein